MPERPDDPATVAELHQLEPNDYLPVPPVPVIVTGDVRTQELPGKLVAFSTFYVDSNIRVLASRDDRRARISLAVITTAKAIVLGTSLGDIQGALSMAPPGAGGAAYVLNPAMGILSIEGVDPLYAASTDGTAVLVSVMVEQWTN